MKVEEGQAFVPQSAWPDYPPPAGQKGWVGEVVAVRRDAVELLFEDGTTAWFNRPMVEKWNKGVPVVTAAHSKPAPKKVGRPPKVAADKAAPKLPAKYKPAESPEKKRKAAAAEPAAAPKSPQKKGKAPAKEPAAKRAKKEAASPSKQQKEQQRAQATEERQKKKLIEEVEAALPDASLAALQAALEALQE